MQKFSKIFLVFGIIVGVLILGGLIGLLAGRNGLKSRPAVPLTQPTVAAQASPPAPPHPGTTKPVAVVPDTNPETNPGETTPPVEAISGILTNWEEKVDEILGADTDDTNKVQRLFALFPHVPAESKSEVAQHLSNLVSDDDYARLGELLKDAALAEDALDVLMADALNRPNSLKLPQLLEVAQTPSHPKADEAKDILSLFLDEDFGTDWPKWKEKMTDWLKDNPD